MHLFVLCVSLAVVLCGISADDYDIEKGVELGDNALIIRPEGIRCPVWAVSYNVIWLDCPLNINGLTFTIGNSRLRSGHENGRLYLTLDEFSSIPEERAYTLMVKRGNELAASLNIEPKMVPKPTVLRELSRLEYGVRSDNVTILNANTIYLPNFSYDGKGPDAFFWVGKGIPPNDKGRIVPDENGSTKILGRYDRKNVILTLPDGMTVEDIDYLSVWCRKYSHDFGNVKIPNEIVVPPTSYIPLVTNYVNLRISAIDGTKILKFDAVANEDGNGKSSLEFSVYFILLPALLMLYK